jgi:HEAT repeats
VGAGKRALLSQVLQQISAQTGVDFLNLDKLNEKISVHFSNVTLRVGLQILLADMDYGAIGGPDDPGTMRIVILEPARSESTNAGPTAVPPVQAEIAEAEVKDDSPPRFQADGLDPTTDLSVLGQALGDKDSGVREAAIRALAERGGAEAMDRLRQAFQDSDSATKMVMIENIGSTPDVLPLLKEASLDFDVSVREVALAIISNKE